MTYTKGPWVYYPNQHWAIKAICSDDICSLSHNDVGLDEMHGNAHLIAAAPELLEALEDVKRRVDDNIDDWWLGCPDEGGIDIGLVNAAINKAKGSTQ